MSKGELAVRLGHTTETASTLKSCSWTDMSRKKEESAQLSVINFRRPKRTAEVPSSTVSEVPEKDLKVLKVLDLKAVFPGAAVMTSVEGFHEPDTDTGSEPEEAELLLPEPLTTLYDPSAKDLCAEDLKQRCEKIKHSLEASTTAEALRQLEEVTRKQFKCQDWHVHRKGRVTASIFHKVSCLKEKTSRLHIVNSIMKYNKNFDTPELKWGRDNEENAKMAYAATVMPQHQDFQLKSAGFFVKRESPFLGASPDGLLNCTCCGSGVLEVKCPSKYRDGLTGCLNDPKFCLNSSMDLKTNHAYFYQVQLQMYVCDVNYCDFYLWTKTESVIRRITLDPKFLEEPLKKAEALFRDHILPELLTRQHDPSISREEMCYKCERPCFGKSIRCTVCLLSFHYECVHIRHASKNWKCAECKKKKNKEPFQVLK